jgi:hypothetical protein
MYLGGAQRLGAMWALYWPTIGNLERREDSESWGRTIVDF